MIRTIPYSRSSLREPSTSGLPKGIGSFGIGTTIAAITALVALLSSPLHLNAQPPERYQKVALDKGEIGDLPSLPSFDDHSLRIGSDGIETILSESDVRALRQKGVHLSILIPDLQRFYAERAAATMKERANLSALLVGEDAPANFTLGSVAGYYTPEELKTQFEKMRQLYPDLVSEPISIGKSAQGRDILAIRISARPESAHLPEVLYTGMHHAREPISMMGPVYMMWSLLEGYAHDPEITPLLEKRALWFIPLFNPDGYAYNVDYFPQGGGMWRKNRGGADSEGVDLNRNYGLASTWLVPPDGGFDDPASGAYRGPIPFSEPETRAMRDFVHAHDFRTVLNFHSYSNLLIYVPEGNVQELADTAWYLASARELALENGLAHGRGAEAVGYNASATADEWMFRQGSATRHIFAWTPEVGSQEDGFWPTPDRIPALCRRILPMSIRAAWMAEATPRITSWQCVDREEGKRLILTVMNVGLTEMGEKGSVAIEGFDGTTTTFQALRPGQSIQMEIPLPQEIVNRSASRARLSLRIQYGSQGWIRTIDPIVHPTVTLFNDDFEGTLSQWNPGLWDIETSGEQGRVLSDSPYEEYFESNFPNTLELKEPISLVGYDAAELQFDAKVMIQGIYHQLTIEARRSGERTWHQLDGEYLQISELGNSDARTTFRGAERSWKHYSIPLTPFVGEDVVIRFVMETPFSGGPTYDGALIDNMSVTAARAIPSSVAADDEASEEHLSVWPNPCRDRLYLQLHEAKGSSPGKVTVEIFDLLGRVIGTESGEESFAFDVRNLPSGTYILSVKGSEGTIRRKIVRQ